MTYGPEIHFYSYPSFVLARRLLLRWGERGVVPMLTGALFVKWHTSQTHGTWDACIFLGRGGWWAAPRRWEGLVPACWRSGEADPQSTELQPQIPPLHSGTLPALENLGVPGSSYQTLVWAPLPLSRDILAGLVRDGAEETNLCQQLPVILILEVCRLHSCGSHTNCMCTHLYECVQNAHKQKQTSVSWGVMAIVMGARVGFRSQGRKVTSRPLFRLPSWEASSPSQKLVMYSGSPREQLKSCKGLGPAWRSVIWLRLLLF